MKSCSMRVIPILPLLLGLCQAHGVASLGGNSSESQETGEVPVSQLRMLSLGLGHLLQGVQENARRLELQAEQVSADFDGANKNLESLQKQSLQAGRTRRQVRKDLQILSARGDRLWRTVRDLQLDAEDVDADNKATQQRMNRILRKVKMLSRLRSGRPPPLDISSVKVMMDEQSRLLTSLSSEVSARDRLINRRRQQINQLEKQVSQRFPAALRPDPDCV